MQRRIQVFLASLFKLPSWDCPKKLYRPGIWNHTSTSFSSCDTPVDTRPSRALLLSLRRPWTLHSELESVININHLYQRLLQHSQKLPRTPTMRDSLRTLPERV